LTILASLRKSDDGTYFDMGLAERIDKDLLQRTLATLHTEVFHDWLKTSLDRQKNAVEKHLRGADLASDGSSAHSFERYIPASAESPERHLFEADLAIILMLLRAQNIYRKAVQPLRASRLRSER
jgi:hypothetical protein